MRGVVIMNGKRVDSGQTVIESIFMIIFLLALFFFIAEFARAWYLKNSLNNAVRVAVRQAAVTPGLANGTGTITDTASCNALPGGDIGDVMSAVCSSPGVPDSADTQVALIREDDQLPANFGSGDTVTVEARSQFRGVAIGFILPDSAASSASMRYE
jgi:Flp pilus assembly protein TadG